MTDTRSHSRKKSVIQKLYPDDRAAAIEKHASLIGQVVWAWAHLHESFALIFEWLISSYPNHTMLGHTIWGAIATDRTQRDVLTAALKDGYLGDRRREKKILWVLNATNKLAVYRNDVIHTAMLFTAHPKELRTSVSSFGTPFGRWYRLHALDIQRLSATLGRDLMRLSFYVRAVGRQERPSPRRPQLHTLRFLQGPNQPKARRKKKAQRRPREQSRG